MSASGITGQLYEAIGRGVLIGAFAVSVRRDLSGKPLMIFAHVMFAHPAVGIANQCMDMKFLDPLFNILSNTYGWQTATSVLTLLVHLLTFSAFDYLGIMPGKPAGFVVTVLKPFGLFIVCKLVNNASSRFFPTAPRWVSICGEVSAIVAAARCIKWYF